MSMTGSYPKAEILTGPERRRRWSVVEKLSMVAETRERGVTVSLVARRRGVSPNQLFTWRRLAEQGALIRRPRKRSFRLQRSAPSRNKSASCSGFSASPTPTP